MADDIKASPIGLLRCLQALAEEAAELNLPQTAASLRLTLLVCRSEGVMPGPVGPEPAQHLVH